MYCMHVKVIVRNGQHGCLIHVVATFVRSLRKRDKYTGAEKYCSNPDVRIDM